MHLHINKDKIEVNVFGDQEGPFQVSTHLGKLKTRNQARNLDVVTDSDLMFDSHIKTIKMSTYYHLKNLSRIKGLMSQQDLEKLHSVGSNQHCETVQNPILLYN